MTSPPAHPVTARDLFLSVDLTDDDKRVYLASRGFQDRVVADEHSALRGDERGGLIPWNGPGNIAPGAPCESGVVARWRGINRHWRA